MKILWFDDIEVWNQPVFDMPLIGRISIRQMCIIGVALILTLSSRDMFVAIISLAIALPSSMYRYRSLSLDELICNLIIYMIVYKVYPSLRYITLLLNYMLRNLQQVNIIIVISGIIKRYITDKYMQIDRRKNSSNNSDDKEEIIMVNRESVRLKLRLVNKDGVALAGKLATIYLDDDHIASIVSDSRGEIEALVSLRSDEPKANHAYRKGDYIHTLRVIVDGKLVFTQGMIIKYT